MNFIYLIFIYLYTIFILIHLIDSLNILSSLKREVRFTVFEVISVNQTIATVKEAIFKQYYDKQSIFVSAIVHESISKLEARQLLECVSWCLTKMTILVFVLIKKREELLNSTKYYRFNKLQLTWLKTLHATFAVSKCKMHYIDCVNVVSYNIHDVCPKIKFLTQFSDTKTSNSNSVKCPIFGNYDIKNITLDAEKFGTVFSFPTEKWWENYWKFKVILFAEDRIEFARTTLNFYFIEFRSRNNQQKI